MGPDSGEDCPQALSAEINESTTDGRGLMARAEQSIDAREPAINLTRPADARRIAHLTVVEAFR